MYVRSTCKKMRKYLIIFGVLFISSCNLFNSGSYGNAEYYDFNLTNKELIKNIDKFKQDNPQFATRKYFDGLDQSGNFYNIYFYLEEEKALVYCVLLMGRNSENDKAVLGFHYIESDLDHSLYGRINSNDLSKDENKRIKKQVETIILNKLGRWRHK